MFVARGSLGRPDGCLLCRTSSHVLCSVSPARLALSRTRLLTRAAKGFMCRSHSKSGDSVGESENENKDYIPLVGSRLQTVKPCQQPALSCC